MVFSDDGSGEERVSQSIAFSGFLNNLAQKSDGQFKLNPNDWQENGIWYCGTCKEPKQCYVKLFDRLMTCMCACEREKDRQKKEEQERYAFEAKVRAIRQAAFPVNDYYGWTFEKDDGSNPILTRAAKKYVENFWEAYKMNRGLLFFGTVGGGKTFLAVCIANALLDKGIPCYVTSFPRIASMIQGKPNPQGLIDQLNDFELLVIDDFMAERQTEWMNELVQNVIDTRYRSGKPMIITTNMTAQELKNPTDVKWQRVCSRLYEMCEFIEVKHKDRRIEALKRDTSKMKALLGLDGEQE